MSETKTSEIFEIDDIEDHINTYSSYLELKYCSTSKYKKKKNLADKAFDALLGETPDDETHYLIRNSACLQSLRDGFSILVSEQKFIEILEYYSKHLWRIRFYSETVENSEDEKYKSNTIQKHYILQKIRSPFNAALERRREEKEKDSKH
jgi:hypothetical protein